MVVVRLDTVKFEEVVAVTLIPPLAVSIPKIFTALEAVVTPLMRTLLDAARGPTIFTLLEAVNTSATFIVLYVVTGPDNVDALLAVNTPDTRAALDKSVAPYAVNALLVVRAPTNVAELDPNNGPVMLTLLFAVTVPLNVESDCAKTLPFTVMPLVIGPDIVILLSVVRPPTVNPFVTDRLLLATTFP